MDFSNTKLILGKGGSAIDSLSDSHIILYTNNREQFRFTDDGRFKLGLNGSIINTYQDSHLIFHTNKYERLRINDQGRVGIGTSQQKAVLQITKTNNLNTEESMFRVNFNDTWGLKLSQHNDGASTVVITNRGKIDSKTKFDIAAINTGEYIWIYNGTTLITKLIILDTPTGQVAKDYIWIAGASLDRAVFRWSVDNGLEYQGAYLKDCVEAAGGTWPAEWSYQSNWYDYDNVHTSPPGNGETDWYIRTTDQTKTVNYQTYSAGNVRYELNQRANNINYGVLHVKDGDVAIATIEEGGSLRKGKVGIGIRAPVVALHMEHTDAIKIPKGTTAERPTANAAVHKGYVRYNTTLDIFEGYGAGPAWGSLGGVIDVDQDTYIVAESSAGADNDELWFYTAGKERLQIKNSGRVGIGTDNPDSKLELSGNMIIGHFLKVAGSWDSVTVIGTKPNARRNAVSVMYNNEFIIHGGNDTNTTYNDVWKLNLLNNEWSQVTTNGETSPTKTSHIAIVYVKKMFIFGGDDNEVYNLNLYTNTWTKAPVTGTKPNKRDTCSGVLHNTKIYIFGGNNGQTYYNDLWEFNIAENTWSLVTTSGTSPSIRTGHKAEVYNEEMYVFGGYYSNSRYNDLYKYNFSTKTWSQLSPTGAIPGIRNGSTINVYGNELIIFGGRDNSNNQLSDVYSYNFIDNKWIKRIASSNINRYWTSEIFYDGTIYIFGGINESDNLENTVYKLSIKEDTSNIPRDGLVIDGNLGIGTAQPTTTLTLKRKTDNFTYGSGTQMIDFKPYMYDETNNIPYDEEVIKASIYSGIDNVTYGLNTTRGYLGFMVRGSVTENPATNPTLREVMRIDNQGYVGIGSTSPNSILQLSKSVSAEDNYSLMLNFENTYSTYYDWSIGPYTNNGHSKFSIRGGANGFNNINTFLTIHGNNGNVGIGTINPLHKLHIANLEINNTIQDLICLETQTSSEAGHPAVPGIAQGILFKNKWHTNSTKYSMARISAHSQPGYGGQLAFWTNNGANSPDDTLIERLRINEDGNVGIGINTPYARLDIENDGGAQEVLKLYQRNAESYGANSESVPSNSSYSPYNPKGTLINLNSVGSSAQTNASLINFNAYGPNGGNTGVYLGNVSSGDNNGPGNLVFGRRTGATSWSESMRINKSGYVGIGTNNYMDTRSILHIKKNAGISFQADTSQTDSRNWRIRQDDYGAWGSFQISVGSNNTDFGDSSSDVVMTMLKNRNVGIGTTNPDRKVHIVGDVRIEGSLTTNGETFIINTNENNTERLSVTNDGTGPAIIANQKGSQPIIDFQDDGTSVFYIEDGGNVGLGTTNPKGKLCIRNTNSLTNVGTELNNFSLYFDTNNTSKRNGMCWTYNSSYGAHVGITCSSNLANTLELWGTNGRRINLCAPSTNETAPWDYPGLTVYENYVGIGTTDPYAKLHVTNGIGDIWTTTTTVADCHMLIGGNEWGGTSSNETLKIGLGYFDSATANVPMYIGCRVITSPNDTTSALVFGTRNSEYDTTAAEERMCILPNGNVGIGNTSPNSKLHLLGDFICDGKITLNKGRSGNDGMGIIEGFDEHHAIYLRGNRTNVALNELHFYEYGDFVFSNNGAISSQTEKLRIKADGKVGIGTSSPQYKLDIRDSGDCYLNMYGGATGNTAQIRLSGNNNNVSDPLLYLGAGPVNSEKCVYISSRYDYPLLFLQNNSEVMRIHDNGNIGIGTTNPGEKLSVNGSIMIKGSSNSTTTNESKLIFTRDLADSDESEYIAQIYTGNYSGPLILEAARGTGYVKTISNWGENNPIFVVSHADGYERFRINGYGYCTLKPFNNSGINNTWIDSLSNNNKLFFGDANFGIGAGKFGLDMGSNSNSECTAIWCYEGPGRGIRFCSTSDGDGHKVSQMTTRMIVHGDTGNVGIGTTNPGAKLQVNGNILFGDGATAGYTQSSSFYIGLSSNSNAVGVDGFTGMHLESHSTGGNYSQDLKFYTHHYGAGTGGTPRMTIRYDGKVGIGSINPGNFKLKIYNNTGTNTNGSNLWHNHFCIEETTAAGAGMTFKAGTQTGYIYYGSNLGNPWIGTGSFGFATTATGNSTDVKMIITNDGKVGINNRLSTTATLDIWGPTNNPTTATMSTTSSQAVVRISGAQGQCLEIGGMDSANSYGVWMQTHNQSSTSNTQYSRNLCIQPIEGNVGIGTLIPFAKLHIRNNTDTTGTGDAFIPSLSGNTSNRKPAECLRLQGSYNDNGSGALIRFTNYHASGSNPSNDEYNLAGIAGYDVKSDWGGGLCFYTAPSISAGGDLTARMVIDNVGNVGIGTTNPLNKLHTENIRIGDWNGLGNGFRFWQNADADLQIDYMSGSNIHKTMMIMDYDGGGIRIPNGQVKIGDFVLGEIINSNYWGIVHNNFIATEGNNYSFNATNDGYTAINCSSGKDITFRENNNIVMTVISSGVGIGTTSPQTMLDIQGVNNGGNCLALRNGNNNNGTPGNSQILLSYLGSPYTSGYTHKIETRHQSGTTAHENAIDFYLWKNGQSAGDIGNTHGMSITAGGVGIGTTSPYAKLEVSGDLNIAATSDGWNTSVGKGLYLRFYDGFDTGYIQCIDRSNNDTQYKLKYMASVHEFSTRASGETSDPIRMVIAGTGNVGIGTTSPNYALSLGTSEKAFALYENNGNYFYGMKVKNVNGWGINFYTSIGDDSDSNIRMSIKRDSGYVGIGTTSPSTRLHVKDTTCILTLETTQGDENGRYCYIDFKDSGGTFAWFGDGSGGNKLMYLYLTDNQPFVITGATVSSTRVGIGNTNPGYMLDVSGDINFTGTLRQNGTAFSTNPFPLNAGSISGTAIIGKIRVGSWNVGSYDYMSIQHHSLGWSGVTGNYALRQNANGHTDINCSSSQAIGFLCNNEYKMYMNSSGQFSINNSSSVMVDAKLSINVPDEGTMISSPDISQFIWRINHSQKWGIYWSTNGSGNNYYLSTDSNPNEIVFVGNGTARASVDLDNGFIYSTSGVKIGTNSSSSYQLHIEKGSQSSGTDNRETLIYLKSWMNDFEAGYGGTIIRMDSEDANAGNGGCKGEFCMLNDYYYDNLSSNNATSSERTGQFRFRLSNTNGDLTDIAAFCSYRGLDLNPTNRYPYDNGGSPKSIVWGWGQSYAYYIQPVYLTEATLFGSNSYTRLQLMWHTGVHIGAHPNYGGISFWDNYNRTGAANKIAAIGDNGTTWFKQNITCTGDITAFGTVSDITLKRNIVSLNTKDILNKVLKIRPVKFKWVDDLENELRRGKQDEGLIAQEVEKIWPMLVGETDSLKKGKNDKIKYIHYNKLSVYLAGAIQEQQKEINQLKEDKEIQKKEITELRNENNMLKEQMKSILERLTALESK